MKILITMAGLGQRFRDVGYDCPKYMIKAFNKTLFEWSMLSLENFFNSEFIFIAREEDNPVEFINEKCHLLGISLHTIKLLKKVTDGQATTVLEAADFLQDEDQLLIYNIDTFIDKNTFKIESIRGDGFILGFIAEGDKWSFMKINDHGLITAIAEKRPISNIATIGLYYFKSFNLFKRFYSITFGAGKNLVNGEKYIAEIYNSMITHDLELYADVLSPDSVWGLGTPSDLNYFLDNYGK